jgi:hypothetical protein
MTFQKVIEYLLRFLNLPAHTFGTLTIKLQRGEVKHITFEESFDLESLKVSEIKV